MSRGRPTVFSTLRPLFFLLLVRPALLLLFGTGVRHRERLPLNGPAVLVANHNSHLDTLLLLSLFPLGTLARVRPAAAQDYFGTKPAVAWFTRHIIGGLLIARRGEGGRDPLAPVNEALGRGDIVLLFPEGTRGEPEVRSGLRAGLAHLAARHPEVPVVPVFLRGLGHALPRGRWVPVPLNLYAAVGQPVPLQADRQAFTAAVGAAFDELAGELPPDTWD